MTDLFDTELRDTIELVDMDGDGNPDTFHTNGSRRDRLDAPARAPDEDRRAAADRLDTSAAARQPHNEQPGHQPAPFAAVTQATGTPPGAGKDHPIVVTDGNSALRTPHSALRTPEAPNARARARETPHSALTQRIRRGWAPPEIWSTAQPSLSDLWAYATGAPWTTQDGPVRRGGQVYALLVAIPLHAVAYYLLWMTERPTRAVFMLVTALVLYLI